MADQVYKNLCKVTKSAHEMVIKGGKEVLKLGVVRLNSQDPNTTKVYGFKGGFVGEIDRELEDKAYSLSDGDQICLHISKGESGYPEIVDISDAKDATDGKTDYKKFAGRKFEPRDDTGIAVGAAWTNAIEILKAGLELKDVQKMADEVLKVKLEQEKVVRASKAVNSSNTTNVVEAPKLSKGDEARARAAAKKAAGVKEQPINQVPWSEDETEEDLVDNELDEIQFEG